MHTEKAVDTPRINRLTYSNNTPTLVRHDQSEYIIHCKLVFRLEKIFFLNFNFFHLNLFFVCRRYYSTFLKLLDIRLIQY